nr:MAG TPA: hypothetical protein [Caudoviricetes sp.]
MTYHYFYQYARGKNTGGLLSSDLSPPSRHVRG